MPTVFEPIGAGIAVALINKFIINNPNLWVSVCRCQEPHHEEAHEDASSSTTSVNDAELIHYHNFNPWMHT
jgi:hypothetical protein